MQLVEISFLERDSYLCRLHDFVALTSSASTSSHRVSRDGRDRGGRGRRGGGGGLPPRQVQVHDAHRAPATLPHLGVERIRVITDDDAPKSFPAFLSSRFGFLHTHTHTF